MKLAASVLALAIGITLAIVAAHMMFDDIVMPKTANAMLDGALTTQQADQRSMLKAALIASAIASIATGMALRLTDQTDD